jgi:hypothetical protein
MLGRVVFICVKFKPLAFVKTNGFVVFVAFVALSKSTEDADAQLTVKASATTIVFFKAMMKRARSLPKILLLQVLQVLTFRPIQRHDPRPFIDITSSLTMLVLSGRLNVQAVNENRSAVLAQIIGEFLSLLYGRKLFCEGKLALLERGVLFDIMIEKLELIGQFGYGGIKVA